MESNLQLALVMTNEELLEKAQYLAADERRAAVAMLGCLHEIEVRQAHLDLGYGSLFDFVRKHLKYSEGAAVRRINAMRLMRTRPAVARQIADGELSLSVAATAQNFIRKHHLDADEVIARVQGKSTREAERILFEMAPEALPAERVRPVSPTHTEIRIVVSQDLKEKIDELLALHSHSNPEMSIGKLFEFLVNKEVQRNTATAPEPQPTVIKQIPQARRVPARLRQAVWQRDDGRCTICGSRYKVQIDHIIPWALGGTTSLENLRLLCQAHNLHEARRLGLSHKKSPHRDAGSS